MPVNPRQSIPRPNSPDELAALLRDDAQFEPPATAVAAARALQRRIAMRVAGQGANAATIGARIRMHIAELGSSFDRASAVVASWVTTTNTDDGSMDEARFAFAGLPVTTRRDFAPKYTPRNVTKLTTG